MNIENQRGGALIEFVIVLPLLLLIMAGIADFGILFYNKQILTNASREGARAGIVYMINQTQTREEVIDDVAIRYCDRLINFGDGKPKVSVPIDVEMLAYPNDLAVTVTFEYKFILSRVLKLFSDSFGETLDLAGVTVMRME
jgi:Flp pilus assembly protein TadG